jgi:hypothetical protein
MYLAIVFSFNPFSFYYNPGNTIQKTNPSDDLLSDRLEKKILSNYSKHELESILASSNTWLNQIKPKTRSQKKSAFGIDSLKNTNSEKTVISSSFQEEVKNEELKNLLNSTESQLSFALKDSNKENIKIQNPKNTGEAIDINSQVQSNQTESSKGSEVNKDGQNYTQNIKSSNISSKSANNQSVSVSSAFSNISLNTNKVLSSISSSVSSYVSQVQINEIQDLDQSLVLQSLPNQKIIDSSKNTSSSSSIQNSIQTVSKPAYSLNSSSNIKYQTQSLSAKTSSSSLSSKSSLPGLNIEAVDHSSSVQSQQSLAKEDPVIQAQPTPEEIWQKKVNPENSEYIEWTVDDLKANIEKRCEYYGCNSTQLIRVAWCESKFDPDVVGAGKYHGLFQFYTPTFLANSKRVGISKPNIYNPYQQIEVATYMFANGQARQWGCK